jgi:hypothetical protein
MNTDSDESEDDSNERVDGEKDYESDESYQSLLQHKQATLQSSQTGGSSEATATETQHRPSPPNVSEEEEQQEELDQQTVQHEASSEYILSFHPETVEFITIEGPQRKEEQ